MRRLIVEIVLALLPFTASAWADEELYIPPVIQATPVWCWAAVSEMVLEHFGVENASPAGNFQCAIVAAAGVLSGAPQCFVNCGVCVVPAGSAANLKYWIENYSEVASQFLGYQLSDVSVRYRSKALLWDETVDQIDLGNPVIAGISPGQQISMQGTSQHVALIVGYEEHGRILIVNDPFPYPVAPWAADPYVAVGAELVELGQYRVSYSDFVSDLGWRESFLTEED